MDQPSQIERPLPSLDDFEMYYKTDILPAVMRTLDQRKNLWQRTSKLPLFLFAFGFIALALVIGRNFEAIIQFLEANIDADSLTFWFVAFVLVLWFIITVFVFELDETEENVRIEVARRAYSFFGWSIADTTSERTAADQVGRSRILKEYRVGTSWAATRNSNNYLVWLFEGFLSGGEGEIYPKILFSSRLEILLDVKIVVNSFSSFLPRIGRSLSNLGWWFREKGLRKMQTGNREFDDNFVVHSNKVEIAEKLLTPSFQHRALNAEPNLCDKFDRKTLDLSFAFYNGAFMIAVDAGKAIVPLKFDYLQEKQAARLIHNNFVAVESVISTLIVPQLADVANIDAS